MSCWLMAGILVLPRRKLRSFQRASTGSEVSLSLSDSPVVPTPILAATSRSSWAGRGVCAFESFNRHACPLGSSLLPPPLSPYLVPAGWVVRLWSVCLSPSLHFCVSLPACLSFNRLICNFQLTMVAEVGLEFLLLLSLAPQFWTPHASRMWREGRFCEFQANTLSAEPLPQPF